MPRKKRSKNQIEREYSVFYKRTDKPTYGRIRVIGLSVREAREKVLSWNNRKILATHWIKEAI